MEIICNCFQEDRIAHEELSTLLISFAQYFSGRDLCHANSKIKTVLPKLELAKISYLLCPSLPNHENFLNQLRPSGRTVSILPFAWHERHKEN